jgi:hypothetical protein
MTISSSWKSIVCPEAMRYIDKPLMASGRSAQHCGCSRANTPLVPCLDFIHSRIKLLFIRGIHCIPVKVLDFHSKLSSHIPLNMLAAVRFRDILQVHLNCSIQALLSITHDHCYWSVKPWQSKGEVLKEPAPVIQTLLRRNSPCKIDGCIVGIQSGGNKQHIAMNELGP